MASSSVPGGCQTVAGSILSARELRPEVDDPFARGLPAVVSVPEAEAVAWEVLPWPAAKLLGAARLGSHIRVGPVLDALDVPVPEAVRPSSRPLIAGSARIPSFGGPEGTRLSCSEVDFD
mmetsp:Transcript_57581/g.100415  ORF Transcript_57581/g.100415 Transcript_57581/m.100415 type:complete len:120 (-) Transcript_57581:130-489(-)